VAVLAGIATGAVLSVGTDMVLRALGIFPSLREVMANSLLLLATIYRCIYGVLGSYVTARLAPSRPMMYALVLGCLGCAVSILGAVMTWNRGPAFGPHLVSNRPDRDRAAVRLGGRQDTRNAVARTTGAVSEMGL